MQDFTMLSSVIHSQCINSSAGLRNSMFQPMPTRSERPQSLRIWLFLVLLDRFLDSICAEVYILTSSNLFRKIPSYCHNLAIWSWKKVYFLLFVCNGLIREFMILLRRIHYFDFRQHKMWKIEKLTDYLNLRGWVSTKLKLTFVFCTV